MRGQMQVSFSRARCVTLRAQGLLRVVGVRLAFEGRAFDRAGVGEISNRRAQLALDLPQAHIVPVGARARARAGV